MHFTNFLAGQLSLPLHINLSHAWHLTLAPSVACYSYYKCSLEPKNFIDANAVQQGNIDTIVVQQETCLWTFLVRFKHWFGDSVLRHRILSRVISSFLSLRPAWYFPEITFIIYLSINPWCLRIGRFLLPWMPLFNFTARAAWAVNYALRNAMEGTGGFTEGAARSNCQEGLTKAVGYVG